MKVRIPCTVSIPLCVEVRVNLEIVLFLWGIDKEHKTKGAVLTGPFWPTDATSSQHTFIP